MNHNLLTQIKNRLQTDVFKRTQTRLTLSYSALLMMFLILFIFIVFGLLYVIIMHNQKQEIESLASQQASLIQDILTGKDVNTPSEVTFGENQYFYYAANTQGNIVLGDETIHPLRNDFLGFIQAWHPAQNEIRYETLNIHAHRFFKGEVAHQINIMIISLPIKSGNETVGTLYVGENISPIFRLFQMLLILFIGLAILFFGVALYMSHIMSKRALIPVRESYMREREFVGNASHELRTPLSVLLASIDTLEMEQDEKTSDFSRKVLRNMKDEVKRMTKLVSDLLTLARSDSGQEVAKHVFDFQPYAKKVVESFEPLAASKQIEIEFHAANPLRIYGNTDRLTELLYILIDNAIKYTPAKGKVTVTLMIQAEKQNSFCMMVQDTGIGIKPEDYKRIFDRFYREEKSRSKQIGGYGLGLSIAKWIVDTHKGTIQVESTSQGSTFTVTIPFLEKNSK